MYLDYTVEIPESKGKITYREKNGATYVYYEYDRVYDALYDYYQKQISDDLDHAICKLADSLVDIPAIHRLLNHLSKESEDFHSYEPNY